MQYFYKYDVVLHWSSINLLPLQIILQKIRKTGVLNILEIPSNVQLSQVGGIFYIEFFK